MNKLITIIATFLTFSAIGQEHITDSVTFLKFETKQVECKKRYMLYNPNIYEDGDTMFFSPPKFLNYLFSDYEFKNIGTFEHQEYSFDQDLETGEISVNIEYQSDSSRVSTYFGEISKDSLLIILTSEIVFIDGKEQYPINNNYSISISTDMNYKEFFGADLYLRAKLEYEIMQANKGSFVILNHINFNSKESLHPTHLGAGYWKIN